MSNNISDQKSKRLFLNFFSSSRMGENLIIKRGNEEKL